MSTSNASFAQSSAAGFSPSGIKSAFSRIVGWAPVIVGLIFLYYGAGKAAHLATTILSLEFIIGRTKAVKETAEILALVVAVADLYLSFLLLLAKSKRGPVIATLCCLGIYSVYLSYLASMHSPPDCGCGGMIKFFYSNRANAAVGLIRNLGLMSYLGAYYYFKQKLMTKAKR